MKINLALVLLLGGLAMCAVPVVAKPVTFAIPPQSLSKALLAFSAQANVQVVTAPGLELSRVAKEVQGSMEPSAALDLLLSGTRLEYEFTSSNSVVIRSRAPPAAPTVPRATLATPVSPGSRPAQEGTEIEEIIVTAQRRQESVERTPLSASVVTSKDLSDRQFNNIIDLDYMVPSLSISSPSIDISPKFTLRGVGSSSYNQNVESTVPVYLDEFVLAPASAQLDQAFDLERIEVLSGPQGTLYGKNSTGGAINLITRKPTGENTISGSLTAARYGEFDVDMAADMALGSAWSVRVAAQRRVSDGYGINLLDNSSILGTDYSGGRVTLRYASGDAEVLFKLFGSKTMPSAFIKTVGVNFDGTPRPDGSNPISGYVTPGNPFIAAFTPTNDSVRNLGAGINAEWTAGSVKLHSVTGYLDSNTRTDFDCDGSPALLCAAGPFDTYSRSFSQEIRAEIGSAETGRLMAGASYLYNKYDITDGYKLGIDLGIPEFFDYVTEKDQSYAAFVDGTYPLGKFNLTAGVRFTHDAKDFHHYSPGFNFVGAPYDYVASKSWTEPTYRLVVDYTVSDNQMLYASFSKGYRAGAFDAGLITSKDQFRPVDPEFVNNYEIGLKANYFNRRIVATMAAFREDYKDQQLVTLLDAPGAICCSLVNAGSSRIDGLELAVQAAPTANLSLRLTGSALHARYKTFSVGTTNYAGDALDNAPKFEVFFTPEYHVAIAGGELFAATDVHRTGQVRRGTTVDPFNRDVQKPYTLVDARVGYRGRQSPIEVVAFIKNLQDRRYLTDWASFATFGFDEVFYGPPRTYGLTVSYSFPVH